MKHFAPASFYTEWTIERGEDDAFDVLIKYSFLPGHPGVLSGPPEHCFPPEPGEVEILNVLHNGQPFDLTDDEQAAIEMWIIENPPEPDYPEDY